MTPPPAALPRLAVVSDIPVERRAGGMLQIYRLLATYPPDRLLVLSTPGLSSGDPAHRLPGVTYREMTYRFPRLIYNRLNPATSASVAVTMRRYAPEVAARVGEFAPEAVLTVSHMHLWFTAAAAAERLGVPLHLILHDDWPACQANYQRASTRPIARWACHQVMRRIYRRARSRLCISPGMEEHYRACFGVRGQVLYPCRGEDSPAGRVRVRPDAAGPPVVAYCGFIHPHAAPRSWLALIRKLADTLAALGGHLDLYTQMPREQLEAAGLTPPTVRYPGFLPPAEMGERIGRTAHALFLNASFEPSEREEVATLFPSKLTDYTAIGLPILVWGPAYSSAARWAAENPDAAILVIDEDPGPVRDAITRVVADPDYAARLAAAAVRAGDRYFDPSVARSTLFAELLEQGRREHVPRSFVGDGP
jgi:hypothetical protein